MSHAPRDCRVDLSDQVEEILANTQAKSAFLTEYPSSRTPIIVVKSVPLKSSMQGMFSPVSQTGRLKKGRSRQQLPI